MLSRTAAAAMATDVSIQTSQQCFSKHILITFQKLNNGVTDKKALPRHWQDHQFTLLW